MSSRSSSPSLPSDNDSELSSSMNEDVPEVIEGEFIPYDEILELVATQEEAAALYNFYRSWHLYICRSVFGHSTFFVASLVFKKGNSCCVIRRNFIEPSDRVCASFWVVSISIFFPGIKNREYVVYLYSTLWRRSRLWLELFASTVVDYHICLNTFFFGDSVALLWDL